MINKLIEKIQKTHAPIVVGLDPMLNYVPEHIQKRAFAEYGETLEGAAEAICSQDLMRISLRSIRISVLTASNRSSRSAKKKTKVCLSW